MATYESKLLLAVVLVIIGFVTMIAGLNYSFNTLSDMEQNNMVGNYWIIGFIITLALIVSLVWYGENHLQQ